MQKPLIMMLDRKYLNIVISTILALNVIYFTGNIQRCHGLKRLGISWLAEEESASLEEC
jgi:hypothetical protein